MPSWISGWLSQNKELDEDQSGDSSEGEQEEHMGLESDSKRFTTKVSGTDSLRNHVFFENTAKSTPKNLNEEAGQSNSRKGENSDDPPEKTDMHSYRSISRETQPYIPSTSKVSSMEPTLFNTLHQTKKCGSDLGSKPAFRISAFMTPNQSTGTVFNTSLNSSAFDFTSGKRSPFYTGHTMFGGSSGVREMSAKRRKLSPVSSRVRTARTQISAKPLTSQRQSTVTSETAKRILNTLDKLSAPVKDSRKLPVISENVSLSQQLRKSVMKTTSKIPLKGFSLEKSNVTISKHVSNSKTISQNVPSLSLVSQGLPTLLSAKDKSELAKTNNEPSDNYPGFSKMKMKRDKSYSHYKSGPAEEEVNVNTMPEVTAPVPLIINSLPNFKFSATTVKMTTSTAPKVANILPKEINVTPTSKAEISVQNKKEKSFNSKQSFNFSTPGVLCNKTLLTTPNKNFAFSSPVAVTSETNDSPKHSTSSKILDPEKSKPVNTLAQRFARPSGSWECSVCMITNQENDAKCIACSNPKPDSKKPSEPIRKLNIKVAAVGSWSCSTCMVMNKPDSQNCAACSEAKPKNDKVLPVLKPSEPLRKLNIKAPSAGSWTCLTCMIVNKEGSQKCVACSESKPQPPKPYEPIRKLNIKNVNTDTWSCPTCMIVNKNDLQKCAACSEPKVKNNDKVQSTQIEPVRKLNIPTRAAGSWDCPTCMITNKEGSSKCVACSELKPQEGASMKSSNFPNQSIRKLNIPAAVAGSWSCPTCMITNKPDSLKCVACSELKPGSVTQETSVTKSSLFSFGQTGNNTKSDFTFGTSNTEGFSFGKTEGKEFSFGPKKDNNSNGTFAFGQPAQKNSGQTPSFSFGKPTDTKVTPAPTAINGTSGQPFSFTKPANDIPTSNPAAPFSFGQSNNSTSSNLFANKSTAEQKPAQFSFGKPSTATSGSFGQTSLGDNTPFSSALNKTDEPKNTINPFASIADASKAGFLDVPGVKKPPSSALGEKEQNAATTTGSDASRNIFTASEVAKPNLGFNLNATNVKPQPVFGSANTESASKSVGFTFGTSVTASSSNNTSNLFSFGANSNSAAVFGSSISGKVDPPSYNFGTNVSSASNSVAAPSVFGIASSGSYSFGQSAVNSTAAFSTKSDNNTGFQPPTSSATSTFAFGAGPPSFLSKGNDSDKKGFDFSSSTSVKTEFNFSNGPAQANIFNQPTEQKGFSIGQSHTSSSLPERRVARARRRLTKR